MRIATDVINDQVDYLAQKLAGATIEIYDGEPPSGPTEALPTFRDPLVVLRLATPAFSDAKDGKAIAKTLETQGVLKKGVATWARLTTVDGDTIDMDVRARDDADARDADIVMSETDLRRGDIVGAKSGVLKLPV